MSRAVCDQNKREVENDSVQLPLRFITSFPCSLFHHFQSFITPPPSVPLTHQEASSPPLSFSLTNSSAYPPFPPSKKYSPTSPPICSVIQSWRQSAVAGEVSDDVLEENAGNSAGQSSPRSILSFLICCASIFKITLRINNAARACLLLLVSVAAVIYSK